MISIIFPIYNEQDNIDCLYAALTPVLNAIPGEEFEIVCVDDGSTDNTSKLLLELRQRDPRVKTLRLSRNCGSHAALSAGLNYCHGDCAVVLASDLQDPLDVIVPLLKKWREGIKTVWGVRGGREGESFLTKACSVFYYKVLNVVSSVRMPPDGTDIFLIDRAVIDAFKQCREKNTSVFMSIAWLGFAQGTVEYVKQPRGRGCSKWTLRKKIKLFMDSVLSFSDLPLRALGMIAGATLLLGLIYALAVLIPVLKGEAVPGGAPLMMAILILGGIQMLMLSLVGEYLWRVFDQSRERPQYIIEQIWE